MLDEVIRELTTKTINDHLLTLVHTSYTFNNEVKTSASIKETTHKTWQ